MASVKIKKVKGSLVPVDTTVFIETIRFLSSKDLIGGLDDYLKKNGVNELIMDVQFANHVKKFLSENHEIRDDPKAQVIIMCDCGGGGGGGRMGRMDPLGVRG